MNLHTANTIRTTDTATTATHRPLPQRIPIHHPGDPSYEDARCLWNTAVDLQPAAIAEPSTPLQVSEIVTADSPTDTLPWSEGCAFQPRCANAVDQCLQQTPRLEPDDGRLLRCVNPLEGGGRDR